MGKTSPFTGTQKKANKAKAKAEKFYADESVREAKHNRSYKKSSQYDTRQIAKGKYSPPTDIKQLTKEFSEAQKFAGKVAKEQFKPIQEKAISDYQRYTTPSMAEQYSARGSAAKQALKDSSEDLQRSLASDFSGLQNSIAGNMLNQQSQNRTTDLNARMQANNAFMGHPMSPVSLGMQPAYNPSKGGTSGMGGTIVGGLLGAGGAYAGSDSGSKALTNLFGLGSAGGTTAASAIPGLAVSMLGVSSREVKENIKDYDKGLDIVRDLDVKQYDYTIDNVGRKDNRVGLIAEEVPDVLQGTIGDIKAVDVYALVGLLVNCVKELDEKVKLLEAR